MQRRQWISRMGRKKVLMTLVARIASFAAPCNLVTRLCLVTRLHARLRLAEMPPQFVNSGGRSLHTNEFPGRAAEPGNESSTVRR